MRLTERNPLVIGVVAIAVILAASFAALTIKGDTFARTYSLSANFRDTGGLAGGDLVTIAGVQVGHVGGIRQDGDSVLVTLRMNHGVQVARGSSAAIKVATLLGRKEVTLTAPPHADWNDLLGKGDHILGMGTSPTEVLAVQSDAQAALATLDANALDAFLRDLTQVTAGKAGQVSTIIDGLNRLTSTVNSRSTQVSTLIDAANAVSATVESRNRSLLSAIDNLDAVVANLDARRAELGALLTSTAAAASKISGLIGTNRSRLDAVLADLQTDLGVIDHHQVDLAQTVSYLAGAVQAFSAIGYSGPQAIPTTWANIYTVGVGAASGDPIFGCNGELDAVLTQTLGADPVTNCAQYTGPIPGGTAAGVPTAATGAGVAPAAGGAGAGRLGLPGSATPPSAGTTRDSLNALLVPLLSGGSPAAGIPRSGGGR